LTGHHFPAPFAQEADKDAVEAEKDLSLDTLIEQNPRSAS
jgi:hypothetical protein